MSLSPENEALRDRVLGHWPSTNEELDLLLDAARHEGRNLVPIGLNDKHGDPVHLGDTLRFDEKEWGAPHSFTLILDQGELTLSGAASDIPEWCEILVKADGRRIRK